MRKKPIKEIEKIESCNWCGDNADGPFWGRQTCCGTLCKSCYESIERHKFKKGEFYRRETDRWNNWHKRHTPESLGLKVEIELVKK